MPTVSHNFIFSSFIFKKLTLSFDIVTKTENFACLRRQNFDIVTISIWEAFADLRFGH